VKKGRVSIIIPTYNRSFYLKESIESILNQDYNDIEIIISDNNSTDDTGIVVQNFKDERILYFKNQINLGVVANHNLAIEKCTGEFIHIFSDDDIMLERCISEKVKILNKYSSVGLVHSSVRTINEYGIITKNYHWGIDILGNDKFLRKSELQERNSISDFLFNNWNIVCMPSVLVRRNVIDEIGMFNVRLKYLCDWDLWLRIATKSSFYYLNQTLVSYRQHDSNIFKENNSVNSLIELFEMKKALIPKYNFIYKFKMLLDSKAQIERYLGRFDRVVFLKIFFKIFFWPIPFLNF
jgi:glycosyltransferase involved in cell wall biosynthesis